MSSLLDNPQAELKPSSDNTESGCADAPPAFPPEAELVISALEAAGERHDDRRRHPRRRFRAVADLHLFSDAPGTPLWKLYTRDISIRGVGFITRERLPLGYGGVVQLPAPSSGRPMGINGTLFRCRDIGNGWFEGALYFNREQWMFDTPTGANGPASST
jgi:hypothetical protein